MKNSNPILQTDVATQSTFKTVGVASGVVTGNKPERAEITCVNDSANVIYLQLATAVDAVGATAGLPTAPTAVVGQGVRLNANGGAWFSQSYTGPIAAIATAAASNLTVCEV